MADVSEILNTMADTDESDRFSQGSSYLSTGPIECSLAKKYDSRSPSASDDTSDDTDDKSHEAKSPFPSARLTANDRKEIIDIVNEQTGKPESRVFPKVTEVYIRNRLPHLHQRLKDVVTFGWAFLSSSLLRETRQNTVARIPKCVYCDICIFCASQPVLLITVTLEKGSRQRTQRYNSNVAKVLTDMIEEHVLHSISALHGVVEESDLESAKTFRDKLDEIKSDGSKIVLPGSLDMDQDVYSDISGMFLEKFRKVEPPRLGDRGTKASVYPQFLGRDSSLGSFSEDSGCIDMEEHIKLKRELEEQKTENKVLQWKLATVSSTHGKSTAECMEEPDPEDVLDGSPRTGDLKKRKVYEHALHSLKGDFIKELDSSGILLDVLTQRGLSDVANEHILSFQSREERNRKLLDTVQRQGMIPYFIEALEYTGTHFDLVKKLRTKVEILTEMPFLTYEKDAYNTSSGGMFPVLMLENTDTILSHEMEELVMYKQPEKVNIMDSKRKSIIRLCFNLSALLHDGKLELFESYLSRLRQQFCHDPNVWFHVLECRSIKQRMFCEYDLDHAGMLEQMEDLITGLTHPVAGRMILLVRRGSAMAITENLQKGLELVKEARSLMEHIQPCIDTGMVMYALVNLLMLNYESECTAANKEMLIKTIAETIEVHISQASSDMRDEFSRVFYLKLAFCYLGIGVWGKNIGCPVTVDDLKAAEACFRMIGSIPGAFVRRRSMFFSLAQAVLHYHRNNIPEALKYAEDAKLLAETCGFRKELGYIDEFAKELHTLCYTKDSIRELDEALTDLKMLSGACDVAP